MNLQLNPAVASHYASRSQQARLITEAWANENLFCVACPSEHLVTDRPNTPVRDFTCSVCSAIYQLKSKHLKHGQVVQNSAFGPKIAAIDSGRVPHYVFLEYSRNDWVVTGLFVVPGPFFTRSIVQPTKALKPTARRAGWIGSKILLGKVPLEGRISLVLARTPRDPAVIHQEWKRVEFLRNDKRASGGWGAEALSCVRTLVAETGETEFTPQHFYSRFVEQLSRQHPENHHIRDKIRQQLQVLRDGNLLEFQNNRGRYRVLA